MKHLIIILVLLFIVNSINSQYGCYKPKTRGYQNAIGIIYQPIDNGFGVRYDRRVSDIGFYVSSSYGNYYMTGGRAIKDHIKTSLAMTKYFDYTHNRTFKTLFSLAMSYHSYGEKKELYMDLPMQVLFPISVDIGGGVRINRFNSGFCYDFIKSEAVVNFGFCF
jgi:hypothetical protein